MRTIDNDDDDDKKLKTIQGGGPEEEADLPAEITVVLHRSAAKRGAT